jgi:hypothetical protein
VLDLTISLFKLEESVFDNGGITMVTKATKRKGSRVKVGKLKLTKETVKNLNKTEAKKVKGGGSNRTCAAVAMCMAI